MSKANLWKLIGVLAAFALLIGILIWGPFLGPDPEPGPEVRTPSMENIPPDGHLTIEIEDEKAPAKEEQEKDGDE